MKFAFVSHVLPPSWSGQAMTIYRLLRDFDPNDYCLISRQNHAPGNYKNSYCDRLPAIYYPLSRQFRITREGHSRLDRWLRRLNVLRVVLLARQIADIVRREDCSAVVACTGALLDPPAGYLASRLLGLPFYPYLFDYYSCQWIEPIERFSAQRFEPIIVKGAAGVIVPNEFLRDELQRRYGVECTVIHNPCDISEYERVPNDAPNRNGDEIRIVYTGAVYEAQYDAFRNLLAAIQLLKRPNAKVHLYTAQSRSELDKLGICGPVVHHEHQAVSDMPCIQRQADLLFLPLAFTSPYPEVIRTSAPGKMGEYLAAGRPILVHAPSDSFLTWYFRQHDCGLVVDQSDPAQLAQAIERILGNPSLRQRLSAHTSERARSDFSISSAQSKFAELMKLDVPRAL